VFGAHAAHRVVVAAAVLLAGCGGESDEKRLAELAARPDLEQMVAGYEQMMTQIADRLSAELGLCAWEYEEDGIGEAGCRSDFPREPGRRPGP
jgi:outer membrane PBP1 activator LpoA protein